MSSDTPTTNDAQTTLIAEIAGWSEGKDILTQLDHPDRRGSWWDYLPGTIQEIWASLPLEAKLIAVLWGLHEESMDFRDA
jgi:hypothetical protein